MLLVEGEDFLMGFAGVDFGGVKLGDDDLDAGAALEGLRLGGDFVLLSGEIQKAQADFSDVAGGDEGPLDLRLDVVGAFERDGWMLAVALLQRGHRQGVAVGVGEFGDESLEVVVGGHVGAGGLGVAKAVDEETEEALLAGFARLLAERTLGVVGGEDGGDLAADEAAGELEAWLGGETVEPVVERATLGGAFLQERVPERLRYADGAGEELEERGAALGGDGGAGGEEGVVERVGGALLYLVLENDDDVAVGGGGAEGVLLVVDRAVDGAFVGHGRVVSHLGEERLLHAVALGVVTLALLRDVHLVEVPEVRHRLVGVVDDAGVVQEVVVVNVDRELRAAQDVAHLLHGHLVELARVETRTLRLRRLLALGRAGGRRLHEDVQVRRRDVVAAGRLRTLRPGGRVAVFGREAFRCAQLVRGEGGVPFVGGEIGVLRAEIGEKRGGGAVRDLLEDERLEVEEARRRHAGVLGFRVDRPLAHQRRLEEVHLGGVELLEYRRKLGLGKILDGLREHPQPLAVLLLRGIELSELVETLHVRLLGLEEPEKLPGVKRAGRGERLEGVRGGLLDAGPATGDLRSGPEAGGRDLRRLDLVEADGRPLANLHMVAAEDADGFIHAARGEFLHGDLVGLDFHGCAPGGRLEVGKEECRLNYFHRTGEKVTGSSRESVEMLCYRGIVARLSGGATCVCVRLGEKSR